MVTFRHRSLSTLACLFVLMTLTHASARAADCESDRFLQYYERCYGPRGPYCISCDRCCRNAQANCPDPDGCCCQRSCCYRKVTQFFGPGSCPPTKFWDICVYRAVFPISPWYSNPRDGIHYPAYGSKSPSCLPANSY
ncbi:MAG TPA: hypothetical protein VFG04_20170 [Planctomycetaceae bacterium]|jgi:hypothetical protein|nr:hypothetical protein [Planctomycetaceae bacterium]